MKKNISKQMEKIHKQLTANEVDIPTLEEIEQGVIKDSNELSVMKLEDYEKIFLPSKRSKDSKAYRIETYLLALKKEIYTLRNTIKEINGEV